MAHLRRGLQVELLGVELEAVGVGLLGAGLHAQQRVVCLGVLAMRVVAVVGREQRRADVARDAQQARVHPVLVGEAVVLELDEERVAPEDRLEPRRELAAAVVVVREEALADGAPEAPARGDQTLAVALEQVEVDPGLVEEAVEVGVRRDLDEVAVAGVALGEQREVEDVVVGATRPLEAARRDHVRLHPDDRR